jgi:hypothetical protein
MGTPRSQLARAVVSPRVLRPVLSTSSRRSSRRNERHSAKRTISAYPVCPTRFIMYYAPSPNSDARTHARTLALSETIHPFIHGHGFMVHSINKQQRFATSSSTMGCVGCTAVSGRPSSAIFRRGPSTSPCMTGSRPASEKCPWASIRQRSSQQQSPRHRPQNGSIPHRPRKAISPSCASIRGPSTSCPPWSRARPAPSAPIRSGSSKRASWCVIIPFIPYPPANRDSTRHNHVTRRDIVTR